MDGFWRRGCLGAQAGAASRALLHPLPGWVDVLFIVYQPVWCVSEKMAFPVRPVGVLLPAGR